MTKHRNCFSSLLDQAIIAETARIKEEAVQGKQTSLAEYCRRVGFAVETALALAAEDASSLHRQPMRAEVVEVDGKALVKFVPLN